MKNRILIEVETSHPLETVMNEVSKFFPKIQVKWIGYAEELNENKNGKN